MLHLFPYPSIKACVLGAQKNRLIEMVLLSTHNICFGLEIRKIIFKYTLLSGGMDKGLDLHVPVSVISKMKIKRNSAPSINLYSPNCYYLLMAVLTFKPECFVHTEYF